MILIYRSPPYAPRGVEKFLEFVFVNTANWPKSRFFSDQKKAMKIVFNTKTARTRKADIKNSDNTPHISLGTWGLGVDLVGGIW